MGFAQPHLLAIGEHITVSHECYQESGFLIDCSLQEWYECQLYGRSDSWERPPYTLGYKIHISMQAPPFTKTDQLNNELDITALTASDISSLRLPGQPQIYMNHHRRVTEFLNNEFLLTDLEEISSRLWMMSKHDHKSISPLHRQRVKGREIIITEDPRLHLIWYHDRIFIKPLPKYILSHFRKKNI